MSSKFCRVCCVRSDDLTSMGRGANSYAQKLATCVPEIDLYIVEDPVICKTCSHMVDVAYQLREVCLKNEKSRDVTHNENREKIKAQYKVCINEDTIIPVNEEDSDDDVEFVCQTINRQARRSGSLNCCSRSFYCSVCDKSFREGNALVTHHRDFHQTSKSSEISNKTIASREQSSEKNDKSPSRQRKSLENPKPNKGDLNNVHSGSEKTIVNCDPETISENRVTIFSSEENLTSKNSQNKNHPDTIERNPNLCDSISEKADSICDENIEMTHFSSDEDHAEIRKICEVCGESLNSSDFEQHALQHLENLCQTCGKMFPSKTELLLHSHIIRCCGTPFKTVSLLQVHTFQEHGKSCGICAEKFSTFSVLFHHLPIHMEKPDQRCTYCNATFQDQEERNCKDWMCEQCGLFNKTSVELENHRIQALMCEDCNVVFRSIKMQHGHVCVQYVCEYCGVSCASKFRYDQHLMRHKSGNSFYCKLCLSMHATKSDLLKHYKTHRLERCQLCKKIYGATKALSKHYLIDHCNKSIAVNLVDFRKHGLIPDKKSSCRHFVCVCDRVFFTAHAFYKHMNCAHAYCDVCEIALHDVGSMLSHFRLHNDPKQNTPSSIQETRLKISGTAYFCETCNIEFKNEIKYLNHVEVMHDGRNAGAGRYCQMCHLHFEIETEYLDHLKNVHHQCYVCKHSFDSIDSLLQHVQTHNSSNTTTHKVRCKKCNKIFLNQTSLQKHTTLCKNARMKTRDFMCNLCKKRFLYRHTLKLHLRSHNAKNIPCTFCERIFKNETNYNKHVRLIHGRCTIEGVNVNDDEDTVSIEEHADETVISCATCKATFESKEVLMNHVQTHIDLYIVEDPLICIQCLHMIDVAYKLREVCLKNEKLFIIGFDSQNNAINLVGDVTIIEPENEGIIEDVNRQLIDLDEYEDVNVVSDTNLVVDSTQVKFSVKLNGKTKSRRQNKETVDKKDGTYCAACKQHFRTSSTYNTHCKGFHRLDKASEIESKINVDLVKVGVKNIKHAPRKKLHFKCHNCDVMFDGEKMFDRHKKTNACCTTQDVNPTENSDEKLPQRKDTKPFKCSTCGDSFKDSYELKIHFLTHEGHSCQICSKTFKSNDELITHIKVHVTKCCGMEFQVGSLLQMHTYKTHGKSCGICNESYPSFNELSHHLQSHSIDRPKKFQCEECKGTFKSFEHMRSHRCVRYKCEICNMICRSKVRFDSHVKSHDKITNYECVKCDMKFTTKFSYSRHCRKTHNEKPADVCIVKTAGIQCVDCHRTFISNEKIRNHSCVKYTCELCDAVLISRYRLERHLSRHNQEKNKKCNQCDAAFTSKSSLIRHIREVHGETCQLCKEVCDNPKILTDHYMQHHCKSDIKIALVDCMKYKTMKLNHIKAFKNQSPKFFCYACNKNCFTTRAFFKHVRLVHKYCQMCLREHSNVQSMVTHIYKHYREFYDSENNLIVDLEVLNNVSAMPMAKKTKTYKCDVCEFESAFTHQYDEHMLTHEEILNDPTLCFSGEYEFSDDAYIEHLKIAHNRCYICKQSIVNPIVLSKHIDFHNKTNLKIDRPADNKCEYRVIQNNFQKSPNKHFENSENFKIHADSFDEGTFIECKQETQDAPENDTFENTSMHDEGYEVSQVTEQFMEHNASNNFSCLICWDKMESKNDLMCHIQTHVI